MLPLREDALCVVYVGRLGWVSAGWLSCGANSAGIAALLAFSYWV